MILSYSQKKESYLSIFLALRICGYSSDFELKLLDLYPFISAFCDLYDVKNVKALMSLLQDKNVLYFNISFGDYELTKLTIFYKDSKPVFKSFYLDDIEKIKV